MWMKIFTAFFLAVAAGACQTVQPVSIAGNSYGLQTDGDCIIRQVPVYDAQSGNVVDLGQRFCGNKVRVTR
jgi:hypothetical protein